MSSIQSRSAVVLHGADTNSEHETTRLNVKPPSGVRQNESLAGPGPSNQAHQSDRVLPAATNIFKDSRPDPQDQRDFGASVEAARDVPPVPRITIGAFCESHDVLTAVESSARDRLMGRTTLEVYAGGTNAAAEYCRHNPTPNLIIVESRSARADLLVELEGLADVCDPGTRVLVIGHSNDIALYRELTKRGVSEYIVAPIGAAALIATISGIYRDVSTGTVGKVLAFIGAKGGVGASTIAHNVSWTMGRRFGSDVVLADLDLTFGTAGLNFNIDTNLGISEAIYDAGRLDEVLFDRLLTKCDDHFSVLAAPARLEQPRDPSLDSLASLVEIAQSSVPYTVLDIPHMWNPWTCGALMASTDIVIVATPDLANLRNAKNIAGFLKQARPHDAPPRLVLNQVGLAKRPEISSKDFARAVELEPLACIPFDAQLFGTAANNGKMIANVSAKSPVVVAFAEIANAISGRTNLKDRRTSQTGQKIAERMKRLLSIG